MINTIHHQTGITEGRWEVKWSTLPGWCIPQNEIIALITLCLDPLTGSSLHQEWNENTVGDIFTGPEPPPTRWNVYVYTSFPMIPSL